jgi:hypothetical protein
MTITLQSVTTLTFAGSNPAAQNLTVPADNKATVVFITGYAGAGFDISQPTLAGDPPDAYAEIVGDSLKVGAAVAVWFAPTPGTNALDPAFNAIPTEGPLCQIAYITADGDLEFVDADCDSKTETDTASATSTSATGDYAIAHAQKFGSAPTHNGTDVSGGDQSNADEFGQLFTLTAGSGSTTATAANNYSSVSLIILREDAEPPAAPAPAAQGTGLFSLGFGL